MKEFKVKLVRQSKKPDPNTGRKKRNSKLVTGDINEKEHDFKTVIRKEGNVELINDVNMYNFEKDKELQESIDSNVENDPTLYNDFIRGTRKENEKDEEDEYNDYPDDINSILMIVDEEEDVVDSEQLNIKEELSDNNEEEDVVDSEQLNIKEELSDNNEEYINEDEEEIKYVDLLPEKIKKETKKSVKAASTAKKPTKKNIKEQ